MDDRLGRVQYGRAAGAPAAFSQHAQQQSIQSVTAGEVVGYGSRTSAGDRQLLVVSDPSGAAISSDKLQAKPAIKTSTTVTSISTAPAATAEALEAITARQTAAAGPKPSKYNQMLQRAGGPFMEPTTRQGQIISNVDTDGNPVILPGCLPREGLYCADNDYMKFMQQNPAYIALDGVYPYAEIRPSAEIGLEGSGTLDALAASTSTSLTGSVRGGVAGNIGTEGLTADTTVATNVVGSEVDGSQVDAVLPDSVGVTVGSTDITGVYDWRTYRPRLTYALGQNYGFINGLETVSDAFTGRRKQ
eukprot:gene7880-8076_t